MPQQPSLDRYYSQDVDWKGCGDGHECATVQVPLDYAEPAGETIDLDLLRVPAEGGKAVGSLVVNPGGPGVPGTRNAADATSYFGTEIRQVFDIVGFDPRGVGGSTPIDCVSDERLDAFVAMDPTDTAVEGGLTPRWPRSARCVGSSGDCRAHSTVEVARTST
jgi:pimeloyl-ACP methyl ester carboxylesterase